MERTTFSTGDTIVCNFGERSFTDRGQVVAPPGGYLIPGRD